MSEERHSFNKFTERARKVMNLAREEAQRLRHDYIGTEHFLLGLILENGGVAARILLEAGLDPETARREVKSFLPPADHIDPAEIALTPRALRVIELAVGESRRLNIHYIGTEHLLLGLLREGQSISVEILTKRGVTLEKARVQIIQILGESGQSVAAIPVPPTPIRADVVSAKAEQNVTTKDSSKGEYMSREEERMSKLTEQAHAVLDLAEEEARRLQHNYIGTEHLLLGLARAEESMADQVLARSGAALVKVRSSIEYIIGRGSQVVLGEIGLTPRAKKVVELSIDEAALLNQPLAGPEHLLLGLIREGQGIAVGVLTSLDVNLQQVREQTLALMLAGEKETTSTPVQPLPDSPPPAPASLETYHLTADAKKALALAQGEAHLLHHDHVGPEHLLLGLLHGGQHSAFTILLSFNIDLALARGVVEKQTGTGQHLEMGTLDLTPLAWAYLYLAADESHNLGHHRLDTAHLLLGLTRETQGIIPTLLASLGTTVEAVRTKTFEILQPKRE